MQGKINIINKIKNIGLVCLFAGVFLSPFFPFLSYITLISSCVIYISILANNIVLKGKIDIVLFILCSLSLLWIFLDKFSSSPYINILGMIIVYSFLTWSFKCNTGKWNWFVLIYGTIVVIVSIINIYIESKLFIYGTWILQICIIFKYIDPLLEKIGLEHRKKRLAREKTNNSQI